MTDVSIANAKPTVARPEPPPLRIHHLMACVAVAALQLSLWKLRNPHGLNQAVSTAAAVMEVIRQSLNAVGLTFALFSIYWHFKRYAGLTQPGQCLLIGHAFSALQLYWDVLLILSFGPDFVSAFRSLDSGGVVAWAFKIANDAIYLGLAAFYGWCAWRIADSLPWRITFVVLAFAVFAPLIVILMIHFGYSPNASIATSALIPGCTALLFEMWAVANDLISRRARIWTHWVGVVLSMLGKVMLIISGLINLFHWY